MYTTMNPLNTSYELLWWFLATQHVAINGKLFWTFEKVTALASTHPHRKLPKRYSKHIAPTWSEMTLNYRVIMKRYPFVNGLVAGSILTVKSSLSLTERQRLAMSPPTTKVVSKPHPAPRGFLSKVGPTSLKLHRIARRWLFIYLFIYPHSTYSKWISFVVLTSSNYGYWVLTNFGANASKPLPYP